MHHGEDSRLRRGREDKQVTYRVFNPILGKFEYRVMDKVYCKNCGTEGGYSAREALYIVYFCDDCWEKNQDPSFILMPPDEEIRWRNGLAPVK